LDQAFLDRLTAQTGGLREQGLFKPERVLGSPQQPVVRLADGRVMSGTARGLAEDGSLQVMTRKGMQAVRSGRVVSARAA